MENCIHRFGSVSGGLTNIYVWSDKGKISILCPNEASMGLWEIYCLKGDLFEDSERCVIVTGKHKY